MDLQVIFSCTELQKAHNVLEGQDCYSEQSGTDCRNGLRSAVMFYIEKGKYVTQGQNNLHNNLQGIELSGTRTAWFCRKELRVWADIKLKVSQQSAPITRRPATFLVIRKQGSRSKEVIIPSIQSEFIQSAVSSFGLLNLGGRGHIRVNLGKGHWSED